MPFVLQHLQRYNHESKRSLIKHSNTMAKRRAALDGSLSNSPRGSQVRSACAHRSPTRPQHRAPLTGPGQHARR